MSATSSLVILNFHGIGEPERSLEKGEAPYWISVERFEWILERIRDHPQREQIQITFDDSNNSDLRIAVPRLRKFGFDARFFILTGRLGRPGSLGESAVRELMFQGMQIGSHGAEHRSWPTLGDEELTDELAGSRRRLEDICGKPIDTAGVPFGHYDARVVRALKRSGYITAFTSDGGRASPRSFLQPRTSIRHDMNDATLATIITGEMTAKRRLRRLLAMTRKRFA